MMERVRTYLDDLDSIAIHLKSIQGKLRRGLVIAPGEAGCLMEAANALRDCDESMDESGTYQ